MKVRLLISSRSSLLGDDMRRRIASTSFNIKKCSSDEVELTMALSQFKPHAIIVLLSHESGATMRIFQKLEQETDFKGLPIIIVGSSADCEFFIDSVKHQKLCAIFRPINDDKLNTAISNAIAYTNELDEDIDAASLNDIAAPSPAAAPSSAAPIDINANASELLKSLIADLGESPSSTRKHILVVDDDSVMLKLIKSYLDDIYDVSIVTSGQQALKFLAKKPCDLVLLDYVMPDELGPIVLHKIRQVFSGEQLPVIFLTGVSDKDLIITGMKQNPQDYLLKPVARDVLRQRIARQFK